VSSTRKRAPPLLALASGLVFATTTPPTDFQPGIFIGLVGLAFSLELLRIEGPAKPVRAGAWRGFAFGLGANVAALRFVPEVITRFTPLPLAAGWLALVLLAAFQALPWTFGGALAAWLSNPNARTITGARTVLPVSLSVAIGVYFAGFVPVVFPWTPAGGLTRWPALLQTAELVGERGASFLIAWACALLAAAVAILRTSRVRRALRPAAIGIALLVALTVHGKLRMSAVEAHRATAPRAKVALLEPDFDAMMRWDERQAVHMMDRLTALTKRAEESGAVLTIWPESAYPYYLAHGVKSSPMGTRAVLRHGVRGPVLTGAYLTLGNKLGTNSAILVEPNGAIGPSYDKRHLLWFGETVPLADTFPVLRKIFARGTGIAAGTESIAFHSGPIVATVLNCYEDTLPQAGREAMEPRPNLLVNITNDAWFAGSAEGELHLRLSILRAIESRRDLVRAVNRGPTAWIGATGAIQARHAMTTDGPGAPPPLLADAALLDTPLTFYTRAGDAPLSLLLGAFVLTTAIRRRLRRG
jgi:apolipoprotein N-acyltransferase